MGNRATVIFSDKAETDISPAVYLHWNGGPESVYRFLDEMDRREVMLHSEYEAARFVHIVGDYFDNERTTSLSLGVITGPQAITLNALEPLALGDHGIYVVYREAINGHRTRRVRRFVGNDFDKPPIELSPEKVEQERRAAYRKTNDEYGRIPEVFATMRPEIGN